MLKGRGCQGTATASDPPALAAPKKASVTLCFFLVRLSPLACHTAVVAANAHAHTRATPQGEIFAAEGYAKTTGRVGVCIATSGPGATNLVTGLADAMMDSVPLVAITGQVWCCLGVKVEGVVPAVG